MASLAWFVYSKLRLAPVPRFARLQNRDNNYLVDQCHLDAMMQVKHSIVPDT